MRGGPSRLRQEDSQVEYCLTQPAARSLPLEWIWGWLRRFFTAAAAGRDAPREAPAGREAVNRQAERMLTSYGNSILRLAYSYLSNMSDAEEVLQDTLIQFLKTAPALDGPKHEKAWLLRVAANLSKNRLAYNRLRYADELNEELIAEEREDLSFVWEAVKSLPDAQRAAIHLFYHEGYATAEIGKLLGRREATVRSDLRRGRAKLKEVLREAYDFGEGV